MILNQKKIKMDRSDDQSTVFHFYLNNRLHCLKVPTSMLFLKEDTVYELIKTKLQLKNVFFMFRPKPKYQGNEIGSLHMSFNGLTQYKDIQMIIVEKALFENKMDVGEDWSARELEVAKTLLSFAFFTYVEN